MSWGTRGARWRTRCCDLHRGRVGRLAVDRVHDRTQQGVRAEHESAPRGSPRAAGLHRPRARPRPIPGAWPRYQDRESSPFAHGDPGAEEPDAGNHVRDDVERGRRATVDLVETHRDVDEQSRPTHTDVSARSPAVRRRICRSEPISVPSTKAMAMLASVSSSDAKLMLNRLCRASSLVFSSVAEVSRSHVAGGLPPGRAEGGHGDRQRGAAANRGRQAAHR